MHIHNVFRAYSQRMLLYGRMKDEYIVDVHTYIHIYTYKHIFTNEIPTFMQACFHRKF